MSIWLPPSHVVHGTEPAAWCTICGQPFYPNEMIAGGPYERHVVGAHGEEEVAQHSPRHQAPGLFDPNYEGGDVEWGEWVRKHRETDPGGWARWGRTDDGKHTSGLGDG